MAEPSYSQNVDTVTVSAGPLYNSDNPERMAFDAYMAENYPDQMQGSNYYDALDTASVSGMKPLDVYQAMSLGDSEAAVEIGKRSGYALPVDMQRVTSLSTGDKRASTPGLYFPEIVGDRSFSEIRGRGLRRPDFFPAENQMKSIYDSMSEYEAAFGNSPTPNISSNPEMFTEGDQIFTIGPGGMDPQTLAHEFYHRSGIREEKPIYTMSIINAQTPLEYKQALMVYAGKYRKDLLNDSGNMEDGITTPNYATYLKLQRGEDTELPSGLEKNVLLDITERPYKRDGLPANKSVPSQMVFEEFAQGKRGPDRDVKRELANLANGEGPSMLDTAKGGGLATKLKKIYKKIPTSVRLFVEFIAEKEGPITDEDFTPEELDNILKHVKNQDLENIKNETQLRKALVSAKETYKEWKDTDIKPEKKETILNRITSNIERVEKDLKTYADTDDKLSVGSYDFYDDSGVLKTAELLSNSSGYNIQTSLGSFTAYKNDDGTITIRDKYNWPYTGDEKTVAASSFFEKIGDVSNPRQFGNLLANTFFKNKPERKVEFTLPYNENAKTSYTDTDNTDGAISVLDTAKGGIADFFGLEETRTKQELLDDLYEMRVTDSIFGKRRKELLTEDGDFLNLNDYDSDYFMDSTANPDEISKYKLMRTAEPRTLINRDYAEANPDLVEYQRNVPQITEEEIMERFLDLKASEKPGYTGDRQRLRDQGLKSLNIEQENVPRGTSKDGIGEIMNRPRPKAPENSRKDAATAKIMRQAGLPVKSERDASDIEPEILEQLDAIMGRSSEE